MNDALRRGALDKGSSNIMYGTIEYPNLLNNHLLTQPGEVAWLLLRNLNTVAQCATTEPRRHFIDDIIFFMSLYPII